MARNGSVRIRDDMIEIVLKVFRKVWRNTNDGFIVINTHGGDREVMMCRKKVNACNMETIRRVIESIGGRSIRNFQFDSRYVVVETGFIKSERYIRIEMEITNEMLQRGKVKVSCIGLILSQEDACRQ